MFGGLLAVKVIINCGGILHEKNSIFQNQNQFTLRSKGRKGKTLLPE